MKHIRMNHSRNSRPNPTPAPTEATTDDDPFRDEDWGPTSYDPADPIIPLYSSRDLRKRLTADWGFDEWDEAFQLLLEDFREETNPLFYCPVKNAVAYLIGCLLGATLYFYFIKSRWPYAIPFTTHHLTGDMAMFIWCLHLLIACLAGAFFAILGKRRLSLFDGCWATLCASLVYACPLLWHTSAGTLLCILAAAFFAAGLYRAVKELPPNRSSADVRHAVYVLGIGIDLSAATLAVLLAFSWTGLIPEASSSINLTGITKHAAVEEVAYFMNRDDSPTTQEILNHMQLVAWMEAQELGIGSSVPRVKTTLLPEDIAANYVRTTNTICINTYWLKRFPREELVSTTIHEMAHAWQWKNITGETHLDSCSFGAQFDEATVATWKREMLAYPLLAYDVASHDALGIEKNANLYALVRLPAYVKAAGAQKDSLHAAAHHD